MANKESAKKRNRQMIVRRARNRAQRSNLRTAVKNLRQAVLAGDVKTAQELLPATISVVNSTAQKGIIHRNAAARTTSRLTRAVNAMESASQ